MKGNLVLQSTEEASDLSCGPFERVASSGMGTRTAWEWREGGNEKGMALRRSESLRNTPEVLVAFPEQSQKWGGGGCQDKRTLKAEPHQNELKQMLCFIYLKRDV